MKTVAIAIAALGFAFFAWAIFSSAPARNQEDDHIGSTHEVNRDPDIDAEVPFHPNAVAIGVSVVPGAVVCRDLATVDLVSHLYISHWEEEMQDITSRGASRILRGSTGPPPNPELYGCSMLAAGSPIHIEPIFSGVVQVTAMDGNGTVIRGVTQENMVTTLASKESEGSERQTLSEQGEGPSSGPDQSPDPRGDVNSAPKGAEEIDGTPFVPGKDGVGFPSCVYCPEPPSSEEAREAKINGTVMLRVVIESDGHAAVTQVLKGLGYGLDEIAVQTVQNWRFKAAVGPSGKPVATVAPVEITFHLN